jgi:deoxycitidine kinase/deoxyguanosine kinase
MDIPYKLISIEGDIGAGKTTIIEKLKKENPTWHFIDEPVQTWLNIKNKDGTNILELFYQDKERYSYTFQNCALLSRALNIKKAIDDWMTECKTKPELIEHNVFVTERCLETDYYVFAQMVYDSNYMNDIEWTLYKMWYEYEKSRNYKTTKIIYLNTPPDICLERIKKRNRKGEEGISIEYLQTLDKYQSKWLSEENMPVMIYNNYSELTPFEEIIKFVY